MPKAPRRGRKSIFHSKSWSKLPYPALVEVYRNLRNSDRGSAAQKSARKIPRTNGVCQTWEGAFSNPSLWRHKTFQLGGPKENSSGEKAVLFTKNMGRFLQSVQIDCRHITSNTCESITTVLLKICENLGQSKLKSLVIRDLELERFWKHASLRPKVADCLQKLFNGQKHLEILEVSSAQFSLQPGCEILSTLSERSGSRICTLDLQAFFHFHTHQRVFERPLYVDALLGFTNLRQINIHYSCLNDYIITQWAKILKAKLATLTIRVCSNEAYTHKISKESWLLLTAACPGMTVDMTIIGIGPALDVIPILAPPIPLTYLHYWSGHDIDTELELSRTLRHISKNFAGSLTQLSLDFDNIHDRINEALVSVVSRCFRLVSLRIKAVFDVQTAGIICQMIQERSGNLQFVDMMLCDLTDPEVEELQDLRESLSQFLQTTDLSILLRHDFHY